MLFPFLPFQLLSIAPPGSSGGVEDQTDLLGFTTERSKSLKKCFHKSANVNAQHGDAQVLLKHLDT